MSSIFEDNVIQKGHIFTVINITDLLKALLIPNFCDKLSSASLNQDVHPRSTRTCLVVSHSANGRATASCKVAT